MRGFERVVEWLRPFVFSYAWDFCVVWKLGDDPSRFIEWEDCCCSSGGIINVKVEQDEFQGPFCRDSRFKHAIRSKACEALSHFPSAISLYSGIHGEVAISNQPKWVNHSKVSASLSSQEIMATQVLIPVFGGIVELFASKHIPKDEDMIELVRTECNAFLDTTAETYAKANLEKWYLNTLIEKASPRMQYNPSLSNSSSHPSLERSSNGSSPSIEHPSFASVSTFVSQDEQLKQPIGTHHGTKRVRCSKNVCETKLPEKANYRSKNLMVERKRRQRIKDGLLQLRALVPKISKMDISSTLTDAIEYIGDLQEEEKKLRNKLWEIEERDREKLEWLHRNNQVSTGVSEIGKLEVHVEVNQITKREFLIKLNYEHKRGGFTKLMGGMERLGLRVIDANVTTFNGNVVNVFKVEVRLSPDLFMSTEHLFGVSVSTIRMQSVQYLRSLLNLCKAKRDFQSKELRDLLTNLTN